MNIDTLNQKTPRFSCEKLKKNYTTISPRANFFFREYYFKPEAIKYLIALPFAMALSTGSDFFTFLLEVKHKKSFILHLLSSVFKENIGFKVKNETN